MGLLVIFASVFLEAEGHGDAFSLAELRGGVGDDVAGFVSEDNPGDVEDLGAPGGRGGGDFTGPGCKEESHDGEVAITGVGGIGARQAEHSAQELGGDRTLSLGVGIGVSVGGDQSSDDESQVGRVREVEGTWFEMAPKRRTQVACGLSHSVR